MRDVTNAKENGADSVFKSYQPDFEHSFPKDEIFQTPIKKPPPNSEAIQMIVGVESGGSHSHNTPNFAAHSSAQKLQSSGESRPQSSAQNPYEESLPSIMSEKHQINEIPQSILFLA